VCKIRIGGCMYVGGKFSIVGVLMCCGLNVVGFAVYCLYAGG